jgi:hypothetical protein
MSQLVEEWIAVRGAIAASSANPHWAAQTPGD